MGTSCVRFVEVPYRMPTNLHSAPTSIDGFEKKKTLMCPCITQVEFNFFCQYELLFQKSLIFTYAFVLMCMSKWPSDKCSHLIMCHNFSNQLFMFKAHGLRTCPNKVNVYYICYARIWSLK